MALMIWLMVFGAWEDKYHPPGKVLVCYGTGLYLVELLFLPHPSPWVVGLIEVLMVQAHPDLVLVLVGAEPEARPWPEHSSGVAVPGGAGMLGSTDKADTRYLASGLVC
jgi:hypothetical protein